MTPLQDEQTQALRSPDGTRTVYLPRSVASLLPVYDRIVRARWAPGEATMSEGTIRDTLSERVMDVPAAVLPYLHLMLSWPIPDKPTAGANRAKDDAAWELTLALRALYEQQYPSPGPLPTDRSTGCQHGVSYRDDCAACDAAVRGE